MEFEYKRWRVCPEEEQEREREGQTLFSIMQGKDGGE